MRTKDTALLKVAAWAAGRAVLTRSTFTLSAEQVAPYMIALIRMVGEESVQGLATGRADRQPRVTVRWNALDRDTSHLNTLADDLPRYVTACLRAGRVPRIWIGTQIGWEALELISTRYSRGKYATEKIQRLARLIGILADEARMPGQQAIAVATKLMAELAVTGQSKESDSHLGSVLCWVAPQPGEDPRVDADIISRLPATSMLDRRSDDEVEGLRRAASGTGDRAMRARARIEQILRSGVEQEWELVVRARSTYWGLDLQDSASAEKLADLSVKRLQYTVPRSWYPTTRVDGLATLYREHEYLSALVESLDIRYDDRVRALNQLTGRVVLGEIMGKEPPAQAGGTWLLRILTRQSSLHIRPGATFQSTDWGIRGRVSDITSDYERGAVIINLAVTYGIRRVKELQIGDELYWADTVVYDGRALYRKVYREMGMLRNPLVYGQELLRNASASDGVTTEGQE